MAHENLTLVEILLNLLENAGFQLPQKECITPTRHFNTSAPPLDLSGVDVPANPNSYPSSKQSKSTRRSATAPLTKQMHMGWISFGNYVLKMLMMFTNHYWVLEGVYKYDHTIQSHCSTCLDLQALPYKTWTNFSDCSSYWHTYIWVVCGLA